MTIPRFSIEKKMSEFRDHRPENIRPRMNVSDRAKQFAPFAALGSMDGLLRQIEDSVKPNDFEHEKFYDDLDLSAELMDDIERY